MIRAHEFYLWPHTKQPTEEMLADIHIYIELAVIIIHRTEGNLFSAFTPLLFCYGFAYAAAVSTINVTKPHMYQPNIKVMFNRVNQH